MILGLPILLEQQLLLIPDVKHNKLKPFKELLSNTLCCTNENNINE